MHVRLRQRAVRVLAAIALVTAGGAAITVAATPAAADHLPGYCVGANRPPVGSIEVCTP